MPVELSIAVGGEVQVGDVLLATPGHRRRLRSPPHGSVLPVILVNPPCSSTSRRCGSPTGILSSRLAMFSFVPCRRQGALC